MSGWGAAEQLLKRKDFMQDRLLDILLRYKALLLFFSIIVFGSYGYEFYRAHQQLVGLYYEGDYERARGIAKTIADYFEIMTSEHMKVLQVAAVDKQIVAALKDPEQLHARKDFREIDSIYQAHKAEISAIILSNPEGRVLYRAPFWKDGINRRGNACFDKQSVMAVVETGKPFVSDIFTNDLDEKAFSLAWPVFHEEEMVGVLRIMMKVSKILEIIEMLQEELETFILDEQGRVVFSSQNACMVSASKVIGRVGQNFDQELLCICEDRKAMVAQYGLNMINRKWVVAVEKSISEKFQEVKGRSARNTAMFIVAVCFFIAWLIFLNKLVRKKRELERDSFMAKERSERLLRSVFEAAPGMMSVIGPDREVLYSNWKLYSHAADKSRLLHEPCYSALKNRTSPCESCMISETISTGEPQRFEEIDPETGRSFEVSMFPVKDTSGESTLIAEYAQDITERRKHEEFKEDVDTIMRHDLRSPLTGIIGLSDMLLMKSDITAEKRRECYSHINQSGHLLNRRINNTLDLFKMKNGSYDISDEEFSISKMISRLESQFNFYLTFKRIHLDIIYIDAVDRGSLEKACGGEDIIEGLLENLIKNAYDAASEDSVVTLYVRQEAKNVMFEVHNEGEISPEAKENLFQKYATFGKRGGTGLGLYSALLTARAYNGDIEVASTQAGGTTFRVWLPILKETAEKEEGRNP